MSKFINNLPKETLDDHEALATYLLEKKIHPEAVNILREEYVDGSTLLTLKANDLKELNIKAGPLHKLLHFIENACQVECNVLSSGEVVPSTSIKQSSEHFIKSNEAAVPEKTCKSFNIENETYFNIRDWVIEYDKENSKGEKLEDVLDSGILPDTKRQLLVRIVVAHLVEMNGNAYPSTENKDLAAKSIIKSFKKLKSPLANGYEHYYDLKTGSGFIQHRLKTMRKTLGSSQRKRPRLNSQKIKTTLSEKNERNDLLSEEEYEIKISELQFKMPNDLNKIKILQLMDETRANRKNWIFCKENSKSIVTLDGILEKFPKFLDYKGELILREFRELFNDEDKFIAKFPSLYGPRILQFCRQTKPALFDKVRDIKDDNLKALILLPELLPSPNYMKKTNDPKKIKGEKFKKTSQDFASKRIPNENLIRFVHETDDLILNSHIKTSVTHQPFLICATNNNFEKEGTFYIKADKNLINVGENIVLAFDIFFKMHYVFDIHFAPDLDIFYNFISSSVMEVEGVIAKNCCIALNSSLLNISDFNGEESNEEDSSTDFPDS